MKKGKLLNNVLQGLLIAAAAVVAMPELVSAQDLNGSVSNLTGTELVHVPDIINACFYIGGAAFTGSGLLKLKMYSENPANTKLGEGVGRVSVGAGLLALPYIASAVIATFGFGAATPGYNKFTVIS